AYRASRSSLGSCNPAWASHKTPCVAEVWKRIRLKQTSDSAVSRKCGEVPGPAIQLLLHEHARENWPHVVPAAQTRQHREPGSWVSIPGAIVPTRDCSEEQRESKMKKI